MQICEVMPTHYTWGYLNIIVLKCTVRWKKNGILLQELFSGEFFCMRLVSYSIIVNTYLSEKFPSKTIGNNVLNMTVFPTKMLYINAFLMV